MGFSTSQLDLLDSLVSSMRDEGYLYYLCHQNILTGVSNDYDLIVYFSKEEIFASSGYRYSIPSGSLCYRIYSGNASSYNGANNQRFNVTTMNLGELVDVPVYCHISTNASFLTSEIQPDYCLEVNQYEMQGGILFTLSVLLLFIAFTKLFRRW